MAMSQKEKDAIAAEWLAGKPFKDWLEQIDQESSKLPRAVEDLINVLIAKGVITEEDLIEEKGRGLKVNYQTKKTLRASKPV